MWYERIDYKVTGLNCPSIFALLHSLHTSNCVLAMYSKIISCVQLNNLELIIRYMYAIRRVEIKYSDNLIFFKTTTININ